MMGWTQFCFPVLTLAVICLPAQALIKVQTPVSKMYAGSASVVTAKVTKMNAQTGVIEAAATTLKGDGVGDVLKIKLDNLPAIVKDVKEGAPLVLFIGRRSASNALNLGDTWLFPEPVPSANSNFIVRKELDLRQSFPGTTTALARVVDELKSGKTTMLDEVSPDMFKGAQKPLGAVPAGATAAYTVKSAGAKSQTLVLVTPAGLQYFIADASGLKPTEPIKADRPKFPGKESVPCAVGNFGEDDKTYAICVESDNLVRNSLDGQGPAADFLRLTGERITSYHKDNPKWLSGATVAALDCNGDGKADLFLNTPAGPMLLINRGFGAFFIDADIAKVLKTAAGAPLLLTAKSLCAGYDLDGDGVDDLLIISETGAVTAVMNPKPEKKP